MYQNIHLIYLHLKNLWSYLFLGQKRSYKANYLKKDTFRIVQGGMYQELREISRNEIIKMNFDGYALGGLSVGEPSALMHEIIHENAPKLPYDKPRYVMGIGKPLDLAYAVKSGVDMFDCVIPTRNARNGHLFTSEGIKRNKECKILGLICRQ